MLLTNALFLHLHIWKMVPLEVYRWTHTLKGGNLQVWLTQYVLLCMVLVYGTFNLKKSIQFHYLVS